MEKPRLKLGIVPLIDCAPIVVAKERGFFAEQGLEVEISPQQSWANIRDKVAVGALDGAQMLATMPLSMSLGLAAIRIPVITACGLNLGGNTITLSTALTARIQTLGSLKAVLEEDKAAGRAPLTLAMVYPFSTHHYELRYWLAAGGIDPDRDLRLSVVPPPQMVGRMAAGDIAGFCVGEPWGSLAASMGLGHIHATSADIFAGRLEKVLGVTAAWAEAHPRTLKALIQAVVAAAAWCDSNRAELAEIIARPAYVNVPLDVVRKGLAAPVFHAHAANFPWRSQALWYLRQMQRWGHVGGDLDVHAVAEAAYRPDLYRLALQDTGTPVPLTDHKTEGEHSRPWRLERATSPIVMGADLLLDGARFDPAPMFQETTP